MPSSSPGSASRGSAANSANDSSPVRDLSPGAWDEHYSVSDEDDSEDDIEALSDEGEKKKKEKMKPEVRIALLNAARPGVHAQDSDAVIALRQSLITEGRVNVSTIQQVPDAIITALRSLKKIDSSIVYISGQREERCSLSSSEFERLKAKKFRAAKMVTCPRETEMMPTLDQWHNHDALKRHNVSRGTVTTGSKRDPRFCPWCAWTGNNVHAYVGHYVRLHLAFVFVCGLCPFSSEAHTQSNPALMVKHLRDRHGVTEDAPAQGPGPSPDKEKKKKKKKDTKESPRRLPPPPALPTTGCIKDKKRPSDDTINEKRATETKRAQDEDRAKAKRAADEAFNKRVAEEAVAREARSKKRRDEERRTKDKHRRKDAASSSRKRHRGRSRSRSPKKARK